MLYYGACNRKEWYAMKDKHLFVTMITLVVIIACLFMTAPATIAGETPLSISAWGPYGNSCSFDEFGTPGSIYYAAIRCMLGFNSNAFM